MWCRYITINFSLPTHLLFNQFVAIQSAKKILFLFFFGVVLTYLMHGYEKLKSKHVHYLL